jgi:hypothetical protein
MREQSLCSFSRIESAVAVQMNGAVFLMEAPTNCSIRAISSYRCAEACG